MIKRVLFLLLCVILLAGCAGPQGVKSGVTVDYVGSVEQRNNNSYFVWAWNDTSNAYCTFDAALAAKASNALMAHKLVAISYNGINSGDKDANNILDQGCEHTTNVQVLRLLDVTEIAMSGTASKP